MIQAGDIIQHPRKDAVTFEVAAAHEIAMGAWLVQDAFSLVYYVVFPGRGWKMFLDKWRYL